MFYSIAALFDAIAALFEVIAALFEDNNALFQIKARKPPLYSPPTLGGDKKLNNIELTPPPSEGGGREEVGSIESNVPMVDAIAQMFYSIAALVGSKEPMVYSIAALFFFKALSFGEGLGGVGVIA